MQAIVIIPGYNSFWFNYLAMARRLEDVSGLPTTAVPLTPWHWWTATRAEEGSELMRRLVDTIGWARRRLPADQFILVGHSAGGLLARLYVSGGEIWGRVYNGSDRISSLVTLGTPHCCDRAPSGTQQPGTGWFLTEAANRLDPPRLRANHIRYLAVAGRRVRARQDGGFRERRAYRMYHLIGGREDDVWGDGVVPVRCARLDGAENVVLDDVGHSGEFGSHWYGGSEAIIRLWWPREVVRAS